ncbi:aldehyde ferredoxin oxidoreductase C-terminal domain-containing protein, partial [Neomoorella humiferrea]
TGPSQGHLVELDPMLDEYYDLMGWDHEGRPTENRLGELGLAELWREVR